MTTATIPPPLPRANEQGEPSLLHEQPRRRPLPRRYTMASFDNLVVLANYEEHLREARKMVWRDRGEPAVEIHDLWECLEHGVRGGLRTSPAFASTSSPSRHGRPFQEPGLLPLRFARVSTSSCSWHVFSVSAKCLGLSKGRPSLIRISNFNIFSYSSQEDAYFDYTTCTLRNGFFPFWGHARFARVLGWCPWCGLTLSFPGSFVALYRILLNTFPLLVPARLNLRRLMGQSPSPSRVAGPAIGDSPRSDSGPNPSPDKALTLTGSARLSSVAQAHQTWLRKRSARWHSVVAGAVAGGVAISFEGLSRRKVIAQQLFVRQVTLDIHYL
jgi:hypothetical protein